MSNTTNAGSRARLPENADRQMVIKIDDAPPRYALLATSFVNVRVAAPYYIAGKLRVATS